VAKDRGHNTWVAALVSALENGAPLDLAPGEDVDPTQAAGWPGSRRLPGEALRAALLKPGVKPDPRGLRIRAAHITGLTDLADLEVQYGLHFDSCAFDQPADWRRLTVAYLSLTRCAMPALNLGEADISGDLSLRATTFSNARGVALGLDRASIKRYALLDSMTVTGEVWALGASIGSDLSLQGASLTNKGEKALVLEGAEIKGSLRLDSAIVTGEVFAPAATIGGQLNLQGANLTNEGGTALVLSQIDIRSHALLNNMTVIGAVWALSATIGGKLDMHHAKLTNEGGSALVLDQIQIKGEAHLDPVTVTGAIQALGATIVGALYLQGATLTNKGGIALKLDRAEIKGDVLLNPVTVTGAVHAVGATITGVLNLQGASLTNPGGTALEVGRAEIEGHALLNRVVVTGAIRAADATIGSQLVLEDATLINPGGEALDLTLAQIKNGAQLSPAKVTGELRAAAATIGGQLDLEGATLTNEGGDALVLQSARLSDLWLMPSAVKGTIRLDGAQIAVLITPARKNEMKVLTGNELYASGWRLGDVRGRIREDPRAAADWLGRDSTAKEFVAQPWHELANVYERNGQPADARRMRSKAAWGVTHKSPWWSKLIRWIYGLLTGHGYYPLIAAVWLTVAIGASWLIVETQADVFTPTAANQKVAWKSPPTAGQSAAPITGATPCNELQDRSSCLRPLLYAFDNALPGTLATGQAAQWTANGARGVDTLVLVALGALKIFSWILVVLLIAGVTGLLRKT
jgi:hypothetical protein